MKVNAINDAIDNYINNKKSEINFDEIISSNLNYSINTNLYELCDNKGLFIIKNNDYLIWLKYLKILMEIWN